LRTVAEQSRPDLWSGLYAQPFQPGPDPRRIAGSLVPLAGLGPPVPAKELCSFADSGWAVMGRFAAH